MKVALPDNAGTVRLWNPVIAEFYDYADRPTVRDDNTINVKAECARRLGEEYERLTVVDPPADNPDDEPSNTSN